MSKGKTFNLYDDTLQEVLSAAKCLAATLDKQDLNADNREQFFDQARAIDTLREHLLCPTCCNQKLNDVVVNICGGVDAHGPKTNYKKGDRVRLVSISGIDKDRFLQSNAATWPYEVTVVCADQEAGDSFGHDLLVECRQHDSVYWVDFDNVEQLSRFGWIDGYVRKGEHVVEISGMQLSPEPSLAVRDHSPDGFSWGYNGSGPNQLGLAILLQYGSRQFALRFYQDFTHEVIVPLKKDKGFAMHGQAVVAWIVAHSSDDHIKKDCQPSNKLWWMVTPNKCACLDSRPAVPAYEHDLCECGTKTTHLHCFCGGRLD